MNKKIKDAFLGFIVADALGVPFEFLDRKIIKKKKLITMTSGGVHNMPKGTYSDDTSLMLASVKTINDGFSYEKLYDNFKRWLKNGEFACDGIVFDVGATTRKNLSKPFDIDDVDIKKESGNGSLMRMLPFVFFTKDMTFEERKDVIFKVSKVTHKSDLASFGSLLYVEYFLRLLSGLDKEKAYVSLCQDYLHSSPQEFERLLSGKIDGYEIDEIKSFGYVVDTLEAVFWSFLRNSSYKDAVECAIRLGNDTDTIGAITGSLAGYYYSSIPDEWLKNVRNIDYCLELINDFLENK